MIIAKKVSRERPLNFGGDILGHVLALVIPGVLVVLLTALLWTRR
jgi:hypothetical protein